MGRGLMIDATYDQVWNKSRKQVRLFVARDHTTGESLTSFGGWDRDDPENSRNHAVRAGATLCGKVVAPSTDDWGQWLKVHDGTRITCPGCLAAIDRASEEDLDAMGNDGLMGFKFRKTDRFGKVDRR